MISDETREKWETKIETIFEAAEVGQCEMNDWETDFMENIHNRVIYQNQDLSWKQSKTLNAIYERIG